jgi:peptidoglycan/xylan/chitin deacetylase (PgdA/CDA1 family)
MLAALLALAVATTGPVDHGPRSARRVALTFDACTTTREAEPYDARIPEILRSLRAPATLFVGGGWVARERAVLAGLARDPLFEIANHAFHHPHLTRLSEEAIRSELRRAQDQIASVTGRPPTLFRAPYGELDRRVVDVAASLGLTTVEYDLPSGDPDARATRRQLVDWVVGRARPGSIVVMHMNHPRFHTAEALPDIVAGLRARGFELVTVGELLQPAGPGSGRDLPPGPGSGRASEGFVRTR